MVNRWFNPNEQLADDTGLPYAGGFLYFYASGTSTPQNTYSDSTLVTPNANPVVLDSAGRAGNIFLAQLSYKVVLKDADGVQIWTADPVWSSDYSTVAQFQVYAGTPNGHVAGTAGTQGGLPSSVIWDNVNNILYVCTTTGSASTAVWTAVNSSTTTATTTSVPQGYLTLTSGTPYITSDVTGATAVYYTPLTGNSVPIYGGSAFTNQNFTELTLTLTSSQAADTLYDVFVFNNSGTLTLVTGPAWSTSTAGSGSRGSGAGTTQIQQLTGIWVNSVQITGRNAATTYTIAANQATYLGTLYMDHTAGQVSCHRSWGQNRKWGAWNAYNRSTITLQCGDNTASWTYSTNTVRAANNAPSSWSSNAFNVGSGTSANGMTVLQGLANDQTRITFSQNATDGGGHPLVTIGWNSTTSGNGFQPSFNPGSSINIPLVASFAQVPAIGINTVVALETSPNAGTCTFKGTNANMVLAATWRA